MLLAVVVMVTWPDLVAYSLSAGSESQGEVPKCCTVEVLL